MNNKLKFRIAKFRKLLMLVECSIVRKVISAGEVYLQEPAEANYNCPPDDGDWKPVSVGAKWGQKNQWAYFRTNLEVPADWQEGQIELRLRHDPKYFEKVYIAPLEYAGPEGQVFVNGTSVGAIDREHHSIRYTFKPGETYNIRAVFFAARV